MSRYIDLEELEKRIKENIKPDTLEEKALIEWCKDECIRQAYAMPRGDVVEVRHGEWIKLSGYSDACCSKCQRPPKILFGVAPLYCPNCGAKMDGERKPTNE